tara:strand:- start:1300 stop:1629 length:330 start_codon:yes stop_codon:yes gene_type:complete
MANLNKTECECNGFYDNAGGCLPYDPTIHTTKPCPNVWNSIASWNWREISETGLEWGYGLGLLERPDRTDNTLYMMELERQRRQTQYIMIGLVIIAIILAIVLVKRRNK